MTSFLSDEQSVYDDFRDYGIIYTASLYTSVLNDDFKMSDVTVEMRAESKGALKAFLSEIDVLRQNREESWTSAKTLPFVSRKVKCISACSQASIRTAQTEADADEILTQIRTRLLSADPTKLFVIASPLFVDLLSGIGVICDDFKILIATGIQIVKEFLLTPAPALLKLSKIQGQVDYSSLRHAAIETYTKLITLDGSDENLGQAQLAQLSTKLLR